MVKLCLEFRKELCQHPAESFNPRLSLWVFQRAVRVERFVRLGHGDLVGQHDDADVAEDRADVDQPSQTAKGTGRTPAQEGIKQFPGGSAVPRARKPRAARKLQPKNEQPRRGTRKTK